MVEDTYYTNELTKLKETPVQDVLDGALESSVSRSAPPPHPHHLPFHKRFWHYLPGVDNFCFVRFKWMQQVKIQPNML